MKPVLRKSQIASENENIYLVGGYKTEKRFTDDVERDAIARLCTEFDNYLVNGWSTQDRFLTKLTEYAINDVGNLADLRHLSPYQLMISTNGHNSVYGDQFVPSRVKNAVKNHADNTIASLVKKVLRAHLTR